MNTDFLFFAVEVFWWEIVAVGMFFLALVVFACMAMGADGDDVFGDDDDDYRRGGRR